MEDVFAVLKWDYLVLGKHLETYLADELFEALLLIGVPQSAFDHLVFFLDLADQFD